MPFLKTEYLENNKTDVKCCNLMLFRILSDLKYTFLTYKTNISNGFRTLSNIFAKKVNSILFE